MNKTIRKTPEIIKTTDLSNIKKLVDKIGVQEAGKMLGLAGETISQGIRDGEMRLAYEMAAELALRNMTPRQDRFGTTYVVKLTPEQAKIIQPLIDGLGIQYLELDF